MYRVCMCVCVWVRKGLSSANTGRPTAGGDQRGVEMFTAACFSAAKIAKIGRLITIIIIILMNVNNVRARLLGLTSAKLILFFHSASPLRKFKSSRAETTEREMNTWT